MFKIGEFSKLSQLTIRALRHYEELGLLIPASFNEETGYRYYSSEQLIEVNEIKSLQGIGLSLKDIKEVREHKIELQDVLIQRELQIIKEKEILESQLYMIQYLKHQEKKEYDVLLKTLPKRKVMSYRKIIPTYYDEHSLWDKLYSYSVTHNIKQTTPPFGMTIFHDSEHKEKDLDVEVVSDVVKDYDDGDDIKFYEVESFEMASIVFKGSYNQMDQVVQTLAKWIEMNHYEICGPVINIPHKSPATVKHEDDYITETGYIVRKQQ